LDVERPSSKTFYAIKNDLLMARKTHSHHLSPAKNFGHSLGITRDLQGRHAHAGADYDQHEFYPLKRNDQ
jgi:hypothetical protein